MNLKEQGGVPRRIRREEMIYYNLKNKKKIKNFNLRVGIRGLDV